MGEKGADEYWKILLKAAEQVETKLSDKKSMANLIWIFDIKITLEIKIAKILSFLILQRKCKLTYKNLAN